MMIDWWDVPCLMSERIVNTMVLVVRRYRKHFATQDAVWHATEPFNRVYLSGKAAQITAMFIRPDVRGCSSKRDFRFTLLALWLACLIAQRSLDVMQVAMWWTDSSLYSHLNCFQGTGPCPHSWLGFFKANQYYLLLKVAKRVMVTFHLIILSHDQDTVHAEKGCAEMCDFHVAALMFLTGHQIKARTYVLAEIARFPTPCIIRTWKALSLRSCASEALMMHLRGKCAILAWA